MSETVRVYFDAKGADAPSGCSAIDALESVNAEQAAAVRGGERVITDSRGLPIDPLTPVYSGAIFRVIRARSRDLEESTEL